MREFELGDIVYLKSGSPAMTVMARPVAGDGVLCTWFDVQNRLRSARLRAEVLTPLKPSTR